MGSYSGDEAVSRLREAIMSGSSVSMLEAVLTSAKVLIFHGHLDLLVPLRGTSHLLSTLQWPGREEFHSAEPESFFFDDEGETLMGGYHTTGGNLTFLVVNNAGGMVAASQPALASQILTDLLTMAVSQEGFNNTLQPPSPDVRHLASCHLLQQAVQRRRNKRAVEHQGDSF